jgi:hypothetical protein
MKSKCVPCRTRSLYEEVKKMDKHFRLLGTKKRITELLLSESGAVDVKKAISLGAVVTGSMLAAMLLSPTKASAIFNCGNGFCQDGETCCQVWYPPDQKFDYWCCGGATPHCSTHFVCY